MPVPSSKFINVSGFPFLSLICLTLLIKATNEAFLILLFNSLLFVGLSTSIAPLAIIPLAIYLSTVGNKISKGVNKAKSLQ